MSYSSQQTKSRILSSAKELFLEKGYDVVTLRELAEKAKVTTGALYNHFESKEGLFDAIIEDFSVEFLDLYEKVHLESEKDYDFESQSTVENVGIGTHKVLEFIYSEFELSKLLINCSKGSKYENFIDLLIEIEEQSSLKVIGDEQFKNNNINLFFVHVISTSGVNNMIEVIRHELSKDEAFEYISKVQKFYYTGFKELLTS